MANEAKKVTGTSGSQCPQSGPYRSSGQAKVVIFVKQGETFPPDVDGTATTWTLLTAEAA